MDISRPVSSEKKRILVVDDEGPVARGVGNILKSNGYEVAVTMQAQQAIEIFADFSPHLVLTDLIMPVMGGVELCRHLRSISKVPIIVLSGQGEERLKVEALDAGADDYLLKPFREGECLARVRAVLRRAPSPPPPPEQIFECDDFSIDFTERIVTVRGEEVHFARKEFDVLAFMVRRPGIVIEHEMLLRGVWGFQNMLNKETLRVCVVGIRKKIEPDPGNPRYIRTVRWRGYRFDVGNRAFPEGDEDGSD